MALSLLNFLNEVGKRLGFVAGDAGAFTALVDTARQKNIDTTVQIVNEVINLIYSKSGLRGEAQTYTITLVDGTREYGPTPTTFLRMFGSEYDLRVMVEPGGNRILEYPGGYERMFADQSDPADFTGQPHSWAFSEESGTFRFDRIPDSEVAGDIYSFLGEKELRLALAADTFPFPDPVVRALVPVVADLVRMPTEAKAREDISASEGFITAIRLIHPSGPTTRYGVRRVRHLNRGTAISPLV